MPQLQLCLQWPRGQCLQGHASQNVSLLDSSHLLLELLQTAAILALLVTVSPDTG
jgi:hypothetical protein